MCEALRRLMKDEIEETLEKATKEANQAGLEKGIAEGRVKGMAEGQTQTQKKTSIALSKMGMSVENIASAVDATIAQVQSWINDNNIEPAEAI